MGKGSSCLISARPTSPQTALGGAGRDGRMDGLDGGAVRMQGRGRGRQGGGSMPGHLGPGWRGAQAVGSGGLGREAVERPLPSVLEPLPCARWGLGACSSSRAVQEAPCCVCGQVHTPAHLHTCVCPYPWCTLCTHVHTQLPRPDSREATLAPGPHSPGWHTLLPPHCPSLPHLRGGGVSAPRWTLAATLPHHPAGPSHVGPCGGCPGPRADGTQAPARAGPGGRPVPSGRARAGPGASASAPNHGTRLLVPLTVPEGAGLLLCTCGPDLVPTSGVYLSSGASVTPVFLWVSARCLETLGVASSPS